MHSIIRRVAQVAAFVFTTPLALAAQDETLLRGGPHSFGGFGGPMVRVTQAAGETVLLAGGGGAMLIDRRLAIGGAGFGGTAKVDAIIDGNFVRGEMDLGYGGVFVEFITKPSKLVHATFGTLLGGGAVMVWPDSLRPRNRTGAEHTFGVIEPYVGAEVNIVQWMRIGATAGYRTAFGAEDQRLVTQRLSGASGSLVFRFGKF